MQETLTKRLKNVAGQINGIVKMIEEEKDCMDIINQLKAARSALKKVNDLIAEQSLTKCLGSNISTHEKEQISKLISQLS